MSNTETVLLLDDTQHQALDLIERRFAERIAQTNKVREIGDEQFRLNAKRISEAHKERVDKLDEERQNATEERNAELLRLARAAGAECTESPAAACVPLRDGDLVSLTVSGPGVTAD